LIGILNRRRERSRRDQSDPRDRRQPTAVVVRSVPGLHLLLQGVDLGLECVELRLVGAHDAPNEPRNGVLVGFGSEDPRDELRHPLDPLGRDDPKFCKVRSQGVDQHSSLTDEQGSCAMYDQDRLLFLTLDGDKSHRRASDGFTNRLGVDGVVLTAFEIWLHISRGHEPHSMPQPLEFSSPVMRRAASLDSDHTGMQLCKERQKFTAPQTLSQHNGAVLSNSMNLKNMLRDIESDRSSPSHPYAPSDDAPSAKWPRKAYPESWGWGVHTIKIEDPSRSNRLAIGSAARLKRA